MPRQYKESGVERYQPYSFFANALSNELHQFPGDFEKFPFLSGSTERESDYASLYEKRAKVWNDIDELNADIAWANSRRTILPPSRYIDYVDDKDTNINPAEIKLKEEKLKSWHKTEKPTYAKKWNKLTDTNKNEELPTETIYRYLPEAFPHPTDAVALEKSVLGSTKTFGRFKTSPKRLYEKDQPSDAAYAIGEWNRLIDAARNPKLSEKERAALNDEARELRAYAEDQGLKIDLATPKSSRNLIRQITADHKIFSTPSSLTPVIPGKSFYRSLRQSESSTRRRLFDEREKPRVVPKEDKISTSPGFTQVDFGDVEEI